MNVNLNNENAGERFENIRIALGLKKNELAKLLNISLAAVSSVVTKKRMLGGDLIMKLLDLGISPLYIYYGLGSPLNQKYNLFIKSFTPQIDDQNYLPPYLEQHILVTLKRHYKFERNFFNLFYPTSEFISRHLKNIDEKSLQPLTISNAKSILLNFLKHIKINKLLDSSSKQHKTIAIVESEFSDIEIYVLLKYRESFYKPEAK